jgi:hypothetical protein
VIYGKKLGKLALALLKEQYVVQSQFDPRTKAQHTAAPHDYLALYIVFIVVKVSNNCVTIPGKTQI